MSDTDPTVQTRDHDDRSAAGPAIVQRPTGRGRASVVAGAIALALLPVMASCNGDDDPTDPASSVPPVETGLTPADGVIVELEPGSNLPPGQGEGGGGADGDMDVDGDGVGEDDGDGIGEGEG
jgi:hypothetical protein